MADDKPLVGVCFTLEVDTSHIGVFSTCEGLGIEVVLEQREEGGNHTVIWQLPTRMKYSNVKFTRPVVENGSEKLIKWIADALHGITPTTAVVKAMSADGQSVAQWSLDGVVPVRWTGPTLNLDSPKVFMETLEIAHHGFLPKAGAP
jgi:phage tail-like protein